MVQFSGEYNAAMTDEYGNTVLSFTVSGRLGYEVRQRLRELSLGRKGGKERLKLTVDKERNRRSLAANNYFWELCGRIAAEVGSSKNEIYRQYIQDCGVYEEHEILEESEEVFRSLWESQGKGWVVEKLDYSNRPGCILIHAFKGSSTYDTKEMTRLIDLAVQDCNEMGIDTLPPAQVEQMVKNWKPVK